MGKSEAGSQKSELRTQNSAVRLRTAAWCLWLLLAACPSEQECPPAVLVPPGWQDGETSVYDIVRHDSVLYRSTMRIRFDEEVLRPGGSTAGTVPTLRLTTMVETASADEYFADSSVVVMRRDNLEPLRSVRALETDIASFDVQAEYEPGRVSVTKRSLDGTQAQDLRLGRNAYDNEMVPFVLRALPLVPATTLDISAVVPMDMRVLPVQVKVLGTKVVATGLGDIMCREVSLTMQRRETRLWYELAEPHRLAGLFDAERETELRLARYRAGGAVLDSLR